MSDSQIQHHHIASKPTSALKQNQQRQMIAKIYSANRSQESKTISDLLERLGRPIHGAGDLQGLLTAWSTLGKLNPEFQLEGAHSGHRHAGGAHHAASAENSISTGQMTPQEIAAEIQTMLADGVNSLDEIGQIARLVSMAGGALPPAITSEIKKDVKSFLSQALSANTNPQDAVRLLHMLQGMGGGPSQEIIREIKEMVEEFLQKQQDQLKSMMMDRLAEVAAGKIEENVDSLLGGIQDQVIGGNNSFAIPKSDSGSGI